MVVVVAAVARAEGVGPAGEVLGRITRAYSLDTSSVSVPTDRGAYQPWTHREARRQKTGHRSRELRNTHTPDRVG